MAGDKTVQDYLKLSSQGNSEIDNFISANGNDCAIARLLYANLLELDAMRTAGIVQPPRLTTILIPTTVSAPILGADPNLLPRYVDIWVDQLPPGAPANAVVRCSPGNASLSLGAGVQLIPGQKNSLGKLDGTAKVGAITNVPKLSCNIIEYFGA